MEGKPEVAPRNSGCFLRLLIRPGKNKLVDLSVVSCKLYGIAGARTWKRNSHIKVTGMLSVSLTVLRTYGKRILVLIKVSLSVVRKGVK